MVSKSALFLFWMSADSGMVVSRDFVSQQNDLRVAVWCIGQILHSMKKSSLVHLWINYLSNWLEITFLHDNPSSYIQLQWFSCFVRQWPNLFQVLLCVSWIINFRPSIQHVSTRKVHVKQQCMHLHCLACTFYPHYTEGDSLPTPKVSKRDSKTGYGPFLACSPV